MNILSFIATGGAVFFIMLAWQRLTGVKHDQLNLWSVGVLCSLAWWNLCDAFFYVAPTKELAWFWHRLGAPGWCGFIAITSAYFLVMIGVYQTWKLPKLVAFWLPSVALVLRFMLAKPTAFATDLVPSTSGLGWAYVQRYNNVWPFLYLIYLCLYLGSALLCLYRWQKHTPLYSNRLLAKGFVILDTVAVSVGFVSVFLQPYWSTFLPSFACVATLIFGVFYAGMLRDYDFIHLEMALNPGYLLDSCIDAMVLVDESCSLLYANVEAQKILGCDCSLGDDYSAHLSPESKEELTQFLASKQERSLPLNLVLANQTPVICTVSRLQSRRGGLQLCVLCMKEVSELKKIQSQLNYLVHFDDLTGLYNRRYLNVLMEEWQEKALANGSDFELLFLDLTDFKQINDTFGHRAGDAALVAVADVIRAQLAPGSAASRWAGDEFVILHRPTVSDVLLADQVQREVDAIDCTSFAPGTSIHVDIGAALFSEAQNSDVLLQMADNRMYQEKLKHKKNRHS